MCGKEKPLSEFSKSYKNRCKECVAEMTRENRRAEKEFKEIRQIRKGLDLDKDNIDWEQRRYEIAKQIFPFLCEVSRLEGNPYIEPNYSASLAKFYADALIEELKKKQ